LDGATLKLFIGHRTQPGLLPGLTGKLFGLLLAFAQPDFPDVPGGPQGRLDGIDPFPHL
jgi:hypothetical protein